MAIDVEDYYRRFGPMVLRQCRRLLKDEEQAVDAMQDTFVQLLKSQARLRDEAPASLLYRMATHTCLNRLRTLKRRPETRDEELLLRIAGAEVERPTLARLRLGRIFSQTRESTRTIAVLHLLDGMTLEEVAAEVGLSVSGVRTRLRGLRSLLAELEGGGA